MFTLAHESAKNSTLTLFTFTGNTSLSLFAYRQILIPLLKISLLKSPYKMNPAFLNIYKPPSTSPATFYEQFNALLENIYPTTDNLVIIGDFNIHMDTNSNDSKKFRALLGSFDLLQKVNFPTHILGHTIDLVLTKSSNDNISHVHATKAFSDHFSITFKVNITPQRRISGDTITFRKYHKSIWKP